MELLSGLATEPLAPASNAVPLVLAVVVLVLWLATYLYYAIALMTIARKLGTPNAWLAFIPLANIYLMWRMSTTPLWTLIIALSLIILPVFGAGGIVVLGGGLDFGAALILSVFLVILVMLVTVAYVGLSSWWWWRIAEQRNYHGGFGLLLTLPMLAGFIPYAGIIFGIVPLVAIGILAWRDQP